MYAEFVEIEFRDAYLPPFSWVKAVIKGGKGRLYNP